MVLLDRREDIITTAVTTIVIDGRRCAEPGQMPGNSRCLAFSMP
jgi:hypothetical protein